MGLASLSRNNCTKHGPASLYRYGICIHCEKESGVSAFEAARYETNKRTKVSNRQGRPKCAVLTDRELVCAKAYAKGMTYIQIAKEAGIQVDSVSRCIEWAMDKLNLTNRYDLIKWIESNHGHALS